MTMIQSELAPDIGDLTRQVWESVLMLEAVEAPVPPFEGDDPCVSSSVQIVGGWNGVVSLQMSTSLAVTIATTMFELPLGELTAEEIDDAVGEMANMIGGNVKGLLPGPSQLSLPTVTTALRAPNFPGAAATDHLEFVVAGEPFTVTVLEEKS